jgi:hypothetical protein
MKYTTPEEKLEADRKRKREWARMNKDKVNKLTYAERVAKMTMEEYVAFLKRRNIQQKKVQS